MAPLMSDEYVLSLLWHVPRDREIEVYIENDVSLVEKQMMEVRLAKGNGVLIEEIDDLDDPIVWQQDNYHGDNKEEETALLFAELDQLLKHVAFLNVELRESVVESNKRRRLNPTDKTEKGMGDKAMEANVYSKGPYKHLLKWYDDSIDEDILEFKSSPSGGSKAKAYRSTTSKAKAFKFKEVPTPKNPP
ncbi:hypothetical protein Tco_0237537 [Tanacetum coccineum]